MSKKTSELSAAALALHEELSKLARNHAKEAFAALLDEVQNGKGASRISAANSILERGFGKSRQALQLGGDLEMNAELPEEVLSVLDGIYMNMR